MTSVKYPLLDAGQRMAGIFLPFIHKCRWAAGTAWSRKDAISPFSRQRAVLHSFNSSRSRPWRTSKHILPLLSHTDHRIPYQRGTAPSNEGYQQTSPSGLDWTARPRGLPVVRFVESGFKPFTSRRSDIEYSEGRSNFEEQTLESESPSLAYPESDKKPSEQGSKCARNRTVLPFQKPDLLDSLRNDPAFHPSGTVRDRTCTTQGIQPHRNIQPCSQNSECRRIASAVEQDIVLTRHSR